MSSFITKDDDIISSPPIIGYEILSYLKKRKIQRISIFDLSDAFKGERWFAPRNLYFAMIFLFSLDLIEFHHSYITVLKNET